MECLKKLFNKILKVFKIKTIIKSNTFPLNKSFHNYKYPINYKISLKDFKIIKQIGKGSFGKVYLVYSKNLNEYFAMKVLNKKFISLEDQEEHTKTERFILEKINNPFIISLKFSFQTQKNLFLITDFINGGEIYHLLQEKGKFSEELTKFYICELIIALKHLHKNKIIYRDLKPENILINEDGHIKLCDFGLSKILNPYSISLSAFSYSEIKNTYKNNTKAFTLCGTKDYLAPEVVVGKGYDKNVDWWSLGILMYEMLTGILPFTEENKNSNKINIQKYNNKIFKHSALNNDNYDLICKLLQLNPKKRLSDDKIKHHVYFRDVNWDLVYNKKIKPPFIPIIKNEFDISNFDPMFTDINSYAFDEENEYDNNNRNNNSNSLDKKKIEMQEFDYYNFDYINNKYIES